MPINRFIFCVVVGLTVLCHSQSFSSPFSVDSIPPFKPYLVALSVANLDSSVAWYQRFFGFSVFKTLDFPSYNLKIAIMEHSGFRLELIEKKSSEPLAKLLPNLSDQTLLQGIKKIAFETPNLEQFSKQLTQKGIKFLVPLTTDNNGLTFFILADPDGNWVQFFLSR